eukprot:13706329-Alexandrium_andersonii.AAC.1
MLSSCASTRPACSRPSNTARQGLRVRRPPSSNRLALFSFGSCEIWAFRRGRPRCTSDRPR